MEKRRRITSGGGDPRESATESDTAFPVSGKVRVKRCGKSAPRGRQRARQGKPRREQNRIGMARMGNHPRLLQPRRPGWLLEAAGNSRPRGMAVTPGASQAIQNPAYRPTGIVCHEVCGAGWLPNLPGRGHSVAKFHPATAILVRLQSIFNHAGRMVFPRC